MDDSLNAAVLERSANLTDEVPGMVFRRAWVYVRA
jgi:hypothetical protein